MSTQNGAAVLNKRNVLVPVDDSDASSKALDWVFEHMLREGDEVHLFHVIPIPMPEVIGGIGGMEGVVTVDPDPREDQKHVDKARAFLEQRFIKKLVEKNILYKVEIVRFLTDNDSIGEAVCKRANAINAVAVVMASHNKGAIQEFFLGSVTKYCTHHCKQPVVVLR